LDLYKQARSVVKEMKVEFDPKGTVDKLISFKKNSVLPTVEQDHVFKSIMGQGVSVDAVKRVMSSLGRAEGGVRAVKDLQASVVMNALDKALGAASNKGATGQQLFSPTVFVNTLEKLDGGTGKLKIIFKDSPDMLKSLMDLKKSARDVITPSTTKPKGSAPYVDTVVGILGGGRSLPVIKQVMDTFGTGVQVQRSLNTTPQKQKVIEYISKEYPSLAAVLGTGLIGAENDK